MYAKQVSVFKLAGQKVMPLKRETETTPFHKSLFGNIQVSGRQWHLEMHNPEYILLTS
jgi:hypothetical protein